MKHSGLDGQSKRGLALEDSEDGDPEELEASVTGAPHQYPNQWYCLKDGRYSIPITIISPYTLIIERTIIVLGSHTIIRIKVLPRR